MEDSTTRNQEREREREYRGEIERGEERMHTGPVNNRYFKNERDQGRMQVSGFCHFIFGPPFLISHTVLWKQFPCVPTKH